MSPAVVDKVSDAVPRMLTCPLLQLVERCACAAPRALRWTHVTFGVAALCSVSGCTQEPEIEPTTQSVPFHCFGEPTPFAWEWPEVEEEEAVTLDVPSIWVSPLNSHCSRVTGAFQEGFLADLAGACEPPAPDGPDGGSAGMADAAVDAGAGMDGGVPRLRRTRDAAVDGNLNPDASLLDGGVAVDGGDADAGALRAQGLRLGLARFLVLVNVPDVSRVVSQQVALAEPGQRTVAFGPLSDDAPSSFFCDNRGTFRLALSDLVARAELRGEDDELRLSPVPASLGFRTQYVFSQCEFDGSGSPNFSSSFSSRLTGEARSERTSGGPIRVEAHLLVSAQLRLLGEGEVSTDCEAASVNITLSPQAERIEAIDGGVCLGADLEVVDEDRCLEMGAEWFSADRVFDGWR